MTQTTDPDQYPPQSLIISTRFGIKFLMPRPIKVYYRGGKREYKLRIKSRNDFAYEGNLMKEIRQRSSVP